MPIQSEHLETILEAFQGYRSGTRVTIDGIGRFDRHGKLTGIESVEHITQLDPMDIAARLDEFRILKNGWFEGKGRAPKAEDLDWLTDQFELNYSDELPTPFLYPTADGGIQAEWTLGDREVSLDIELPTKKAYWHALNTSTNEEIEQNLDLNGIAGWKWVVGKIAELYGEQAQ